MERNIQSRFPPEGSHLQKYAARFSAVEINSSFYRPHKASVYRRWAESVPASFRFAVKVPKEITHTRRLRDFREPLERFLSEVAGLGEKLGPLLVQLPPSLQYDAASVEHFLDGLRQRFPAWVAWEPRHATWFTPAAEDQLRRHAVARVAADPALRPEAAQPGGWEGLVYRRLHGSPKMYYSAYSPRYLEELSKRMAEEAAHAETYCIFDNTAMGEAIPNALYLVEALQTAEP